MKVGASAEDQSMASARDDRHAKHHGAERPERDRRQQPSPA